MPRKIEKLPPMGKSGSKIGSKYDFLLDGEAYVLVKGEDYQGKTDDLRSALHTWARNRRLRIQTRKTDDGVAAQIVK